MHTDTVTYCNCMGEIRHRISLVQTIVDGAITTGHEPSFDIELVFIQFRKTLELIAFSSLTANRNIYAAAHENFASHWNAKKMLEAVGKLNPNFYPLPLNEPQLLPTGVKHVEPVADGFLEKDEFVSLYDKSSEILHARNPFTSKDTVIQIGYSVANWVSRIQRLLAFHLTHLVDDSKWICHDSK